MPEETKPPKLARKRLSLRFLAIILAYAAPTLLLLSETVEIDSPVILLLYNAATAGLLWFLGARSNEKVNGNGHST